MKKMIVVFVIYHCWGQLVQLHFQVHLMGEYKLLQLQQIHYQELQEQVQVGRV